MKTWIKAFGLTVAFGGLGCGGGEDCPTGGAGTLEVTVTGLPEGTPGAVRLQLSHLDDELLIGGSGPVNSDSGLLTVYADPVAAEDGNIRTAYDAPDGQQVCVRDGEVTTVDVPYARIPSSAKLWIGAQNGAGPIMAWASSQVGTSGSVSPAVVVDSKPQISTGRGIAFDKIGNLWAADANGSLKRFPASGLGASGERAPDVTITSPTIGGGIPGPVELAFDQAGNLWVSLGAARKVIRFTPEQLAQSGSPTAGVELSGIEAPDGLAFDTSGNLWVATGGDRIRRIDVSHLSSSRTGADLSITVKDLAFPTAELGGPAGLAFDHLGNLWVSFFGPNAIAKIAAEDLTGTGDVQVEPHVQINLSISAVLDGLAFDEERALWTAARNGELGRLSPAQLVATGEVTPETIITSSDVGAAHGFAIYPAPAWSPLFHRLP